MVRKGSPVLGRLVVSAAVIVICWGIAGFGSPYTPPEWQMDGEDGSGNAVAGKFIGWSRDTNVNFVDDYIDWLSGRLDQEDRIDIVVDFNRCVSCPDENCMQEGIWQYLRTIADIDYIGRFVTFAVLSDVCIRDVDAIAQREEVAMVEYAYPTQAALDTSVRTIRVRSGAFSPNTVEDRFPNLDGTGVNIAILDSGVDNHSPQAQGTVHDMFPAAAYVGGADCTTSPATFTDPDDQDGHGTHVAGIALGRPVQAGGQTFRGVAPGAGLIDIRVLGADGHSVGGSVERGIETALQQQIAWSIDVVNMSIGSCTYNIQGQLANVSDGRGARGQLINMMVSRGMTVVVAAGNTSGCDFDRTTTIDDPTPANFNMINPTAAADLAITVGNIDDGNTIAWNDDILRFTSFTGPRIPDNDQDTRDERKPEISAPGTLIRSAQHDSQTALRDDTGTSMAAPHVAGTAALILQQTPNLNPGSVKELLIATARQSNSPSTAWDPGWGYGFLDAYEALNPSPGVVSHDVGRGPSSGPTWTGAITTAAPPRIGVGNTMTAIITNHSPNPAPGVRVVFGIHRLANVGLADRYFDLGAATVTIPGNATIPVTINWTPPAALAGPSHPANQTVHACAKVSIDYPWDTVPGNNTMQRNMDVAPASVARFWFELMNPLDHLAEIEIEMELDNPDWTVRFLEDCLEVNPRFMIDPYHECARDLFVELIPPEWALPGDTATAVLRVVADGEVEIGGATLTGEVSPIDRDLYPILLAVYDRLIDLNPDGDFVPALAESFETMDDGLSVAFHLRQEVSFHNGMPFTARDVESNFSGWTELLPGQPVPPLAGNDLIADIYAVDRHTLVFELTQPLVGELLSLLALPSSSIAYGGGPLIGTGPFRFLEAYSDEDRWEFEANFDYWGRRCAVMELIFVGIPDEAARIAGLLDGAVDATIGVRPEHYARLHRDGALLEGLPCTYRTVSKDTLTTGDFEFFADQILRPIHIDQPVFTIALPKLSG